MAVLEHPVGPGRADLDTEIRLVAEPIALVASGGPRRVVVAGLPDGLHAIGPARRLAERAGVRVHPVAGYRDGMVDLVVEPRDRTWTPSPKA